MSVDLGHSQVGDDKTERVLSGFCTPKGVDTILPTIAGGDCMSITSQKVPENLQEVRFVIHYENSHSDSDFRLARPELNWDSRLRLIFRQGKFDNGQPVPDSSARVVNGLPWD